MNRVVVAMGALAAASVLAGCNNQPGDITAAGQRTLAPKVQQVREIAADGSYAQLKTVVRQLKRLVSSELAVGHVSQSRANAIDDAADTLLVDASPSPTPTPSASSSSPTPSHSETPTPTPSHSETPTTSPTQTGSSSPQPTTTISVP